MVMLDKLTPFVQGQHIEANRLQAYRQAFASHPARLIVLRSFLQEEVAEKISRFLTREAVYQRAYRLYSSPEKVSEQAWLQAPEQDRFYQYGVISDIVEVAPEFRMSPNLLTYLRFSHLVVEPEFQSLFASVCGLPLGPETQFDVHAMKRGDFLRQHNDRIQNRRLAFVLYLSQDWSPDWGGALHIVDDDGQVTQVEAEFNSIIVFDVTAHATHFVTPVTCAAGERARLSIGGWFLNPDSPR